MNHKDRQTYIKKMNSERDRINQWEYAMEQAKTEGLARGLAEGKARGLAEGRAEGKAEGKAEEKSLIAKNCKNSGIPYETIAQCTGLTIEEIEKL
jgi:predicted transposase/invertase (TIGR01784 family)